MTVGFLKPPHPYALLLKNRWFPGELAFHLVVEDSLVMDRRYSHQAVVVLGGPAGATPSAETVMGRIKTGTTLTYRVAFADGTAGWVPEERLLAAVPEEVLPRLEPEIELGLTVVRGRVGVRIWRRLPHGGTESLVDMVPISDESVNEVASDLAADGRYSGLVAQAVERHRLAERRP